MQTLWFCIVAFMLTMYVVLDGFDLGVGILHLLIGKTEQDRRAILNAIGPVWDGNEVWLIAAGGVLYFAFPILYASSFSGFYLPLMIVLWLLMLRGIGIEFRHHLEHPMWRAFWDFVFSSSSFLLTIFFGAALGNVVRGVPLKENGFFFEPLWTTFTITPEAGVLDWFTVLMGITALCTLTNHGANYLSVKTEGELQQRSRVIAVKSSWGVVLTSFVTIAATFSIQPNRWNNFSLHPWGFVFAAGSLLGLIGMFYYRIRTNDRRAFLSSSLFIGSMLSSTAFGLFPNVLPASTDDAYSLTVYNTSTHEYGMHVGTIWWVAGMLLVSMYFIYLYRSFRGKVTLTADREEY